MILSKKTRYAIVALTRLAREYGNGPLQIRELAETEKIPQSFLENILLELKKLGIEEVTLAEIVRHFEGTIALMYCVSEKAYRPCEFCKDESTCQIRRVFKEIRDTTYNILNKSTLSDLISN